MRLDASGHTKMRREKASICTARQELDWRRANAASGSKRTRISTASGTDSVGSTCEGKGIFMTGAGVAFGSFRDTAERAAHNLD